MALQQPEIKVRETYRRKRSEVVMVDRSQQDSRCSARSEPKADCELSDGNAGPLFEPSAPYVQNTMRGVFDSARHQVLSE